MGQGGSSFRRSRNQALWLCFSVLTLLLWILGHSRLGQGGHPVHYGMHPSLYPLDVSSICHALVKNASRHFQMSKFFLGDKSSPIENQCSGGSLLHSFLSSLMCHPLRKPQGLDKVSPSLPALAVQWGEAQGELRGPDESGVGGAGIWDSTCHSREGADSPPECLAHSRGPVNTHTT